MASWKITPSPTEESNVEYTSFLDCRKYFAVDDSMSTGGGSIYRERDFVEAFRKSYPNKTDAISLWGDNCDDPTTKFKSLKWHALHDGTHPSSILRNSAALDAIRKSDTWFLLTDGEIFEQDVHGLARLAYDAEVLNVPLVFVITNARGSSPGTADISVGISFFASSRDTLILFKDQQTGKIYVIAAKGCFADLGGSAATKNLNNWNDLTTFTSEADLFLRCQERNIKVVKSKSRAKGTGELSLGAVWEERNAGPVKVDLDLLLASEQLSDMDATNLFADEAFDALAIACKTRTRIPELRAFVQAQKVEQAVAPKFEDRNNATAIIAKMATGPSDEDCKSLQEQLREAHAQNRRDYLRLLADHAASVTQQALRKRNQLVDGALRSLASIETASYNAEIIGRRSDRARRAQTIDPSSVVDMAALDLEAPSFKGYCLVCCGEEEIMSICFKEAAPEHREDNTSDFALNFPLAVGAFTKNVDLVSSQNVCFQCALLSHDGLSIYKERITAIIPAVQYDGNNKKYINDQLYSALTARLATGAAGVAQLFMSILQTVMKTKPWAGAGLDISRISIDEQNEAAQRHRTFQWMVDQLAHNSDTRENFKETGQWVKFPQALKWVAEDFERNGLSSFAITYPVEGFNNLLSLGQRIDAFSQDTVSRLRNTKLLDSIAAKYLPNVPNMYLQSSEVTNPNSEDWKEKYFELIYRDMNSPLVPVDHGEDSILSDIETFKQRLSACLTETYDVIDITTMHKIQVLLFWLLYTQPISCTPQTLFTRLTHNEHLAAAVLNPALTVPASEHQHILLSIFSPRNAEPINPAHAALHHNTLIPFATPFGPSVLRCGVPACAHPFYDPATLRPDTVSRAAIEAIRLARSKHLVDVFGLRGRFENSATGLPERTAAGQPPTSVHSNLHISIVREWAERSVDARRAVVEGGDARAAFAVDVRRRVAVEGRGDVFKAAIERDVEALLPGFFEVLAVALREDGGSAEDVALYEHGVERVKLHDKVVWELKQEAGREVQS
ncbi:hypothetical protein C7974DRAFT_368322 [Boeremia exigua]|uniref:uncharacterized protein n=1 Tax=Boeremia exigua TaxID=749465 RepID=UPI001E8EC922|nr:uncharacterized protein C7974DRAFT_368322 [Boeremia exigua]KAH6614157.1 hypothetical protein C7974DRAFT_368322 [Boeremia exigua]